MKEWITTCLLLLAAFSGVARGGITSGSPSKFDDPTLIGSRNGLNPAPSVSAERLGLHVQAVVVGRPDQNFGVLLGEHLIAAGSIPESGYQRFTVTIPEELFPLLAQGVQVLSSQPDHASSHASPVKLHILNATKIQLR
ncbi:MAG: hypothetical protein AAF682_25640 [Planctomycetota bacterium]